MALEKREDAVVVAETVDPPESPPAALDAVRLDTKNVSNDPTHAWFTHRPGTSPVTFTTVASSPVSRGAGLGAGAQPGGETAG